MIKIYLIWLAGILFSLLFLIQISLIAYKVYKKQAKLVINITLAVVFVMIAIGCISTAFFLGIKKATNTKINYEKIGETIGETAADVTANSYKSFKETWNETVTENDNKE